MEDKDLKKIYCKVIVRNDFDTTVQLRLYYFIKVCLLTDASGNVHVHVNRTNRTTSNYRTKPNKSISILK